MSPSISSATPPPSSDGAATSHPASLDPAAAATRSLREAGAAPPPVLSAPASQESFVSSQSAQSSVGAKLETSSSNASHWTSHTDLTSPTIGLPNGRLRTPDAAQGQVNTRAQHDTAFASLSATSPTMTNGAKRTASGSVKSTVPSLPNTPFTSAFPARRPRTDSISSTGSRAGDLALSLKTRLEYAMAKVQHGWEHKNIHEVEHLARHRTSPEYRHSMSHLDYARRPVTMGNGSTYAANRFSAYETNGHYVYDGTHALPPSKRHSGTFGSIVSSSQPILGTTPRLQPAADIQPASSSQPLQHHRHPQHRYKTPSSNGYGNMVSPPRTPVNGASRSRPPTIRTEMQTAEAEREALQALFQLGSPHGSHVPTFPNTSQVSSSQGSPLRSEFATPRKVTFARSESDSSTGHFSSEEAVAEEAAHHMVEV